MNHLFKKQINVNCLFLQFFFYKFVIFCCCANLAICLAFKGGRILIIQNFGINWSLVCLPVCLSRSQNFRCELTFYNSWHFVTNYYYFFFAFQRKFWQSLFLFMFLLFAKNYTLSDFQISSICHREQTTT